jgi:hypothetical protein
MLKKQCSQCEVIKPITAFAEREDAWGQYAWCKECQKLLDRDKMTPDQKKIMAKTRLFHVSK